MNFLFSKHIVLNTLLMTSLSVFSLSNIHAEKTKPVFTKNSMFIEFGSGGGSLKPDTVNLNNGIIYYSALDETINNPKNQTEYMNYLAYEKWDSKNKFKIQNRGYLRSEISLGEYFSIGGVLGSDRLIIKQVPLHSRFASYNNNISTVFFNAYFNKSGQPLIPSISNSNLYGLTHLIQKDYHIDMDSFTPELGFHLSNQYIDVYLRAGASAFTSRNKTSAFRSTGSIGLRSLVYDPITIHIEAYAQRWGVSTDKSPSFSTKFLEVGMRFGVGMRLQHP